MLIINRYSCQSGNAAIATDDGVFATGITGQRWSGCNPNLATGVDGNAAAGNALMYVPNSNVSYTDEIVSRMFSVTWNDATNSDGYLKIQLPNLAGKKIKGAMVVGILKPNAGFLTWSLIAGTDANLDCIVHETNPANDQGPCLQLKVAVGNRALVQNGNIVNVLIFYNNN